MSCLPGHHARGSGWLTFVSLITIGCSGASAPVSTQPERADDGASSSDVTDFRFLPTQLNVTTIAIDGKPVIAGTVSPNDALVIQADSQITVELTGTAKAGSPPSGTNCVVEFLRVKDKRGVRLTAAATIGQLLCAPNGDWKLKCVANTPKGRFAAEKIDEFELIIYGGKVNRLVSIPVRISWPPRIEAPIPKGR